jgi:hypothetical protein
LNWSGDLASDVAPRDFRIVERSLARDAFDAANALRDAAFGRDHEHRDIARARHMRAAAEFDRVRRIGFANGIAETQDAHFIAILLAEQRHGARLDRLVRRHHLDLRFRRVLADDGVDLGLDGLDLVARHRRSVREVETEIVGFDQRALLRHVLAELVAQRGVQQVRGGVVRADLSRDARGRSSAPPRRRPWRRPEHFADVREHVAWRASARRPRGSGRRREEDFALSPAWPPDSA